MLDQTIKCRIFLDYEYDTSRGKGFLRMTAEYDSYDKKRSTEKDHGKFIDIKHKTFPENPMFGYNDTQTQIILLTRVFGYIRESTGLGLNPISTQLTVNYTHPGIAKLIETKENPFNREDGAVYYLFNNLKKLIADFTGKKDGFKPKLVNKTDVRLQQWV